VRSDLDILKTSTVRLVKRKASSNVNALQDCIAPGQSGKLFKLIQEECHNESVQLLELIVQLYQESTERQTRKLLLSLICNTHTKELKDRFRGLTSYAIDQARLHASKRGNGKTKFTIVANFSKMYFDHDKLSRHGVIFHSGSKTEGAFIN